MNIKFAIVTASDTRDITLDSAGAALESLISEQGWSGDSHVTPEATQDACDRNVPGIAEAIRATSLQKTRRAMLSRALCMQRGTHLVINFPGSEKAARECWDAVYDQLDHAIKMTAGGGH